MWPRLPSTLALAVLLHVAALGGMKLKAVVPPATPTEPTMLEVAIEPPEPTREPPPAAVETATPALAHREPVQVAAHHAERAAPAEHVDPTPAAVTSAEVPAPVASASEPFRPGPRRPLSLADLGLGGARSYGTGPVASAETSRDLSSRANSVLTMPLTEHDRDVGIVAGGPVLHALEGETASGNVPLTSRAVLRATTDAAGVVLTVEVLEAEGDRASWDRIAAAAKLRLASRPLRVRSRSRGLEIRIEINSRMQMPDGSRAGGPTYSPGGFSFDLSNLGARARRVISGRVLDERPL